MAVKEPILVFAAASLVATPVSASVREAAFASSADRAPTEASVFVGLKYGVSLGRSTNAPKVRASFNVARMSKTPNAQLRVTEGVGLTFGAKGKPALLLGGHEIGDLKDRRANLSTGATVAIVTVGVLAVGAVAAYYALRDPCDYKECE